MKSFKTITDLLVKKDKSSSERLQKNRVRVAIENMCQEYLTDFNDVLFFEALPKALDDTIAVIEEPKLTTRYEFTQESDTVFSGMRREVKVN